MRCTIFMLQCSIERLYMDLETRENGKCHPQQRTSRIPPMTTQYERQAADDDLHGALDALKEARYAVP